MTALRKGLEPCPACGRTIRPLARKVPHPETLECKASVIRQSYTKRGWSELLNVTLGRIARETGVPVEFAPAGIHQEQTKIDEGDERFYDVAHDVAFAPNGVVRIFNLLRRSSVPPWFRRRAVVVLWDREDLLDAADSARRLSASPGRLKRLLEALIEEAEYQKMTRP